MEVITDQMTTIVLEAFKEANVWIVNVPANMTRYHQPLDLTVNGYGKRFLKHKFNEWYTSPSDFPGNRDVTLFFSTLNFLVIEFIKTVSEFLNLK